MTQFTGTTPNAGGGVTDHSVIDANDNRINSYGYKYGSDPSHGIVGGGHRPPPAFSFTPPGIPNYDAGQGTIVVNTDALKKLRDNIDQLIPWVKSAKGALTNQPKVAAGGFPDAFTLSNTYKSSLYGPYIAVLNDLDTALEDLKKAIDAIMAKYTTVEELNGMTAAQFEADLSRVKNDFTLLMKANGGNGPS